MSECTQPLDCSCFLMPLSQKRCQIVALLNNSFCHQVPYMNSLGASKYCSLWAAQVKWFFLNKRAFILSPCRFSQLTTLCGFCTWAKECQSSILKALTQRSSYTSAKITKEFFNVISEYTYASLQIGPW